MPTAKARHHSMATHSTALVGSMPVPAESSFDIPAIVNVSVANVYSAPNHRSELTTQAWLGIVVTVNAEHNEWRHITMPDGYTGWTHRANLVPVDSKALRSWAKEKRIIITAHIDFVYSAMDMDASRVCDIVQGNVVRVLDEIASSKKQQNDASSGVAWWHIALPDGRSGYVRQHAGQELSSWLGERTLSAEGLVATARLYLGIPYTWGGTSPKTMDCSGFMRVVFAQHGIFFQRDASQQSVLGQNVPIATATKTKKEDLAALRVGDLLFFGDAIPRKPTKITHVALYIGNSEYIHAAGLVKINSLDCRSPLFDEERYRTLVRAQRYLGATAKHGIYSIKNLYK